MKHEDHLLLSFCTAMDRVKNNNVFAVILEGVSMESCCVMPWEKKQSCHYSIKVLSLCAYHIT